MEIKFEKRANEVVYTFDKIPSSDEDIKNLDEYYLYYMNMND